METKKIGCYYLHLFYPSNLFLEDRTSFDFEFESKIFSILIVGHLKSLMINDFNNKMRKLEEGIANYQPLKNDISISEKAITVASKDEDKAPIYIIDYKNHLYREYYNKKYTEVILSFESSKEEKNIDIGLKALSYFIRSYRIVSNDILTLPLDKMPYVSKIIKESFHIYSDEELKQNEIDRIKANRSIKLSIKQVLFPFWNIEGKKFETNPKKNSALLENFFTTKKTLASMPEFIQKAREEFHIHNNYKYSFIESWTALEMAIVSYLRKIKTDRGISKNKIDDYESEVGISYLINIELPLVHPTNDQKFKELISKVDAIRKLRNKVIHENKEISLEESNQALNTAIEFLNYLGYKKY